MDNEITLNYIDVKKMQCFDAQVKTTKRAIDTIIETCLDYAKMIDELVPTIERPYTKLTYENKSKELKKIANSFIEQSGYCKECKESKNVDDVGLSPLEIMGNRLRNKEV